MTLTLRTITSYRNNTSRLQIRQQQKCHTRLDKRSRHITGTDLGPRPSSAVLCSARAGLHLVASETRDTNNVGKELWADGRLSYHSGRTHYFAKAQQCLQIKKNAKDSARLLPTNPNRKPDPGRGLHCTGTLPCHLNETSGIGKDVFFD